MTYYTVKYYSADGSEFSWCLWNKNGSDQTAAASVLAQLPNTNTLPVIVNRTYVH